MFYHLVLKHAKIEEIDDLFSFFRVIVSKTRVLNKYRMIFRFFLVICSIMGP